MRRFILRLMLSVLGVVAAIALLLTVQLQLGNFHEVVRGELYRSAQPTSADVAAYARDHEIKSILNLRGGNAGDAWYNDEVAASKAAGITHLDFRMKAARELTNEQAAELLDIMKKAPKPLLIHCRSGADRTGLAAALYLQAVKNVPAEEAHQQLSLRYGHLPLWWLDAQAMDRTLARVSPTLEPAVAQ